MADSVHRVAMIVIGCCMGSAAMSCQRETSPEANTTTAGQGAASQPNLGVSVAIKSRDRIARVPLTTTPFLTLEGQNTARTNGNYLVSYLPDQGVAHYWQWDALKPQPARLDLGVKPQYARLSADMGSVLYHVFGRQTVVFKRIAPSEVVQSWPLDREWYCCGLSGEPGGRFIAISLAEELTVTNNFDTPKIRLGLFDAQTGNLSWPITVVGDDSGQSQSAQVVPSHQGRYIAIARWLNRGTMVDATEGKLLWTITLAHTNFVDCEFSPDDKTLYVPDDAESTMFVVDTLSGKVLNRWVPDSSYGRFVSVAVSPNGKWVAAGAGPAGDVCVWAADTGKVVLHLGHAERGTVYGVAFSPDSSLLATSGTHGKIRVWKMP